MLNFSVMVNITDITWQIILDGVNEDAVFLDHTLVDDMIGEFDPLKIFITIDINLLEELHEVTDENHTVSRRWQMMQHYSDESLHVEGIVCASHQVVIIVDHL